MVALKAAMKVTIQKGVDQQQNAPKTSSSRYRALSRSTGVRCAQRNRPGAAFLDKLIGD
jgi:hypothetical protein